MPIGGGGSPAISGLFTVDDSTPDAGDDVTFTFVPSSINFSYTANDYSLAAGAELVLTAADSLEYQLRKNGSPVSGAIDAVNVIEDWEVGDNGSYTLLVTDTATGRSRVFGPLSVAMPPEWLLAGAVWDDSGVWDDSANWIDA
jgi:hypothetical protein